MSTVASPFFDTQVKRSPADRPAVSKPRSLSASAAVIGFCVSGGASLPLHVPIPLALSERAGVIDYPSCRFVLRSSDEVALGESVASALAGAPDDADGVSLLAISTGGERGAYAAGVLDGWTACGDRPRSRVVCGVSVGASIAPLAFVGTETDERMRDAIHHARSRETFRIRSLLAMFTGDSVADSEPLSRSLEEPIDETVIGAVARGHREGRWLYVVTTDLDAERAMVWNLGAIAASGRPDAAAMFRRIILASAAVPVAYPPQYITIEADGRCYDEMHVDGGVMAQALLPLPSAPPTKTGRPAQVWVIMNGKLESEPIEKQPRILSIAARSLQVARLNQARLDAATIRADARASDYGMGVAYIPGDFDMSDGRGKGLDPEFVKELHRLGSALVLKGEAIRDSIAHQPEPSEGTVLTMENR